MLWHTLDVYLRAYDDLELILVLPQEHMETGRTLVNAMGATHRIRMVAGGATRWHSVKNGLSLIGGLPRGSGGEIGSGSGRDASGKAEESLIFVHDGVRCLLTAELIHRCAREAEQYGTAIPVIDSKDSVRLITVDGNEAIDRSRVKLVQTPQTFLSTILLPAFGEGQEYEERFTDEATVVEAFHKVPVRLVEGESHNIKITTAEDLLLAEEFLRRRLG